MQEQRQLQMELEAHGHYIAALMKREGFAMHPAGPSRSQEAGEGNRPSQEHVRVPAAGSCQLAGAANSKRRLSDGSGADTFAAWQAVSGADTYTALRVASEADTFAAVQVGSMYGASKDLCARCTAHAPAVHCDQLPKRQCQQVSAWLE